MLLSVIIHAFLIFSHMKFPNFSISSSNGRRGALPCRPRPSQYELVKCVHNDGDLQITAKSHTAPDTSKTPESEAVKLLQLPKPVVVEVEFVSGRTMRFETGRMAR